jgi:AMP deaminase
MDGKYTFTTIIIQIRKRTEWNFTADWLKSNDLHSPSNRWVIQVPRIYHILKANGDIDNFQDMLKNILLTNVE